MRARIITSHIVQKCPRLTSILRGRTVRRPLCCGEDGGERPPLDAISTNPNPTSVTPMARDAQIQIATSAGSPYPLGATATTHGVDFAVFARHATEVTLLLYDRPDAEQPAQQIRLDRDGNRTGDYWLIPARTATGRIAWPDDEHGEAQMIGPHGVDHHYASLAVLGSDGPMDCLGE